MDRNTPHDSGLIAYMYLRAAASFCPFRAELHIPMPECESALP